MFLLLCSLAAADWRSDLDAHVQEAQLTAPEAVAAFDAQPVVWTRAGTPRLPGTGSEYDVWLLADRLVQQVDGSDLRAGIAADIARQGRYEPELVLGLLAIEGDPLVRANLVHGLRRVTSDEALSALQQHLHDDSARVRQETATVVGLHARGAELAEDLVAGLDDGAPEVRVASAAAIGHLDLGSATPELVEALDDPSSDVRLAALGSLRLMQAPELDALAPQLLDDPDPRFVERAQAR